MAQASLQAAKRPARPACRTDRSRSLWRSRRSSVPQNVADPFDTVEWDLRTAAIKGESGEVLFEQTECRNSGHLEPIGHERRGQQIFLRRGQHARTRNQRSPVDSPGQPHDRQLGNPRRLFRHAGRRRAVLSRLDLALPASVRGVQFARLVQRRTVPPVRHPRGPVQLALERRTSKVEQPENPYEFPQGSACFIQSVQDDMEDIMELARSEAMLFKFGSGTGTDLSTLRSHREKLSGGGKPSGPLSFMRVYDQIAAVVKSGGKTRRAAKMQSIKDWHPDVMEFIECKAKEERKARLLIEKGGYDANFNGEAYSSILFQNANLSVRLSDEFMQAVEADRQWTTHWVTDPKKAGPSWPAREVLAKMAECAWGCGDPGVQYDTTINRWHTCPNSGRINASNPCSEYMFLDDTACNLASINLMKFRQADGTFDVERFQAACRVFFIAQEILVDHASYPTRRIAENSHKFRPLGLGYSNLGSLIMASGLPYDSAAAYGLCGALTALLHGAANLTSAELAAAVGPFDGFAPNRDPMLRVMQMHRDAVEEIDEACPDYLKQAAAKLWDEVLTAGRRHGYRNAQATVLAPTGTISFLMDCDTTGIEPDIALVKYKQLAGGGMLKIVNQTVPLGLKTLGYDQPQIDSILAYVDREDTIEGAADLKSEHLPVFDCAFQPRGGVRSIAWRAHVRMMAAAQPFISGAISKTVNMPRETTPGDIGDAYREGWQMGLKALAVYRDGSKESQPLSTSTETDKASAKQLAKPRRQRLPDTRQSITHKFNVAGHEGYITVGPVRGRPPRRAVHHHGQGRKHGRRIDGFVRHRGLDEPAIRRAPRSVRKQVFAHPFRADGPHQESRHSHRQEHCRLHLPLARNHLLARLSRSDRRRLCRGGVGTSCRRRSSGADGARRQDGRRAG